MFQYSFSLFFCLGMGRHNKDPASFGFTLTNKPRPYSELDKRSQRDVRKQIGVLMEHLGITSFHFGSTTAPAQYVSTARK